MNMQKSRILGNSMWQRAIRSLPGGNGLLSKRPDRYAPDIWPSYFSKSSGVNVIDLDGNTFIDMAQMAIGSSILGYAHPELINSVSDSIKDGVNCTLNSPEEVLLAEKLLDLNPFAGGVRFARSGGEAMAMAVRIARAKTGKDKVIFSGYHGWCDWYLATNLDNKNGLNDHLIPGLSTMGVPAGLANTAIPFIYNDIKSFESIIKEHSDAGIICLEGARYDFPSKEFLESVSRMAKKYKMIIISDEITSGWRMTDGGVYKINGFNPDIVVYAKAMGGGFAISAVVGTEEVMHSAQDTFMSSTMWTERVGFVAALTTIEILTREKVWEHLIKIGTQIGDGWIAIAKKYGLKITVSDFKPLITMKFHYQERNQALVTLFIQEMLKRGYLSATSVYVSYAHTEKIVKDYLIAVDECFFIISNAIENNNEDILLDTKVRSDSFNRITP
ncbi:MAG: aminotransferase class III-fold pyridoxal phosphate-dependent enzyme [Woeseiaceae bacterium]|nr:aminotransferase class III-fold pyridoxal phosphate-dependent enzyme [Woeseiaceae bacterium]